MNAFAGRAVLVTGASRGIGLACALELTRRGLHVVAGVRGGEAGAVPPGLEGASVLSVPLDVTDPAQVRSAVECVRERFGSDGLCGVVNNAGAMVSGPLELIPVDEMRRQFEVNAIGALNVIRAALPLLRVSKGRIVNIGSTSGRVPGRFVGPYAASKAALDALTTTLRLELADAGISVSIVDPGVVATSMWDHERQAQDRWMAGLSPEDRVHYGARADQRRSKLSHVDQDGLDPGTVATVVADALLSRHPRPRYVVGRDARVRSLLARALPERVVVRLSNR